MHININKGNRWRPPSLSELTPIIFNRELTHIGSKTSKYLIFYHKIQFGFPDFVKFNINIIFLLFF